MTVNCFLGVGPEDSNVIYCEKNTKYNPNNTKTTKKTVIIHTEKIRTKRITMGI